MTAVACLHGQNDDDGRPLTRAPSTTASVPVGEEIVSFNAPQDGHWGDPRTHLLGVTCRRVAQRLATTDGQRLGDQVALWERDSSSVIKTTEGGGRSQQVAWRALPSRARSASAGVHQRITTRRRYSGGRACARMRAHLDTPRARGLSSLELFALHSLPNAPAESGTRDSAEASASLILRSASVIVMPPLLWLE